MPLVIDAPVEEQASSAGHERARKIRPQYAEGPLVKAGFASNLAEAELIQGMLLEEGIPTVLRRSRGFDVPDFLAAGPRDVMVPASGLEIARELLAPEGGVAAVEQAQGHRAFAIGAVLALAAAALIVLVLYLLTT